MFKPVQTTEKIFCISLFIFMLGKKKKAHFARLKRLLVKRGGVIIRTNVPPLTFQNNSSLLQDSSRTQILNVNRPSNHPSTTKTRPQVKQARLPTKTAVALGPSYQCNEVQCEVKIYYNGNGVRELYFCLTQTDFG